jgi:hypothetical protein
MLRDLKIENMALGELGEMIPPIGGTLRVERTAGSPLGITGTDAQASAPEKKKEKTIEEVVKDYEKQDGLFTVYRKRDGGKDTVYLEIREDQLERLLLLQATASTGTASTALAAGDPLADLLFKLVRRDEQVLFVVPNLQYDADAKKPIARAAQRSFPDAYLEAFKIEAKSKERKSLLIEVTDLFRSDITQFTRAAALAGGGAYTIDKEKTAFQAIKAFPANLLVRTAYHLSRGGGGAAGLGGLAAGGSLADARSLPVVVNYNLFFIPADGYRPRLSDPRVGFFTTDTQDFSEDREEQMRRYILRWQLEKAEPNAAMSPPKEPIVFWLDNAIPAEYRDAVRKGLLLWNPAFERLGLKNAIVVKQMPDDAEWDHADMRYNVIRWVTSPGSGYAVALFRANPLTGQILNASITVDANLTRFLKLEFARMIDPLSALAPPPAGGRSRQRCTYAEEALPQAWLGYMAMTLLANPKATKVTEQQYIDAFLTSVVAHEMGHILGLRHNFVASTFRPMKALAGGGGVRTDGVVASVMDYNPFNPMALRAPDSEYWTTVVGPYDRWAVEYGYTPIDAAGPAGERPQLKTIAARCNEPGLAYASDEVADGFDPLVTRFDLGQDPLEYWDMMLRDIDALMQRLPERLPEKGESYWQLTRAFNGLLGSYAQGASVVARYVGGLRLSANHRGDAGEKPALAPVSARDQRRALQILRRYIFARDAVRIPKEALTNLAPDPYPDLVEVLVNGAPQDAPVRDRVSSIQRLILAQLLDPATLARMANNEFKVADPKATLTMADLFETLNAAIWEETGTGAGVDALRRDLQRAHLAALANMLLRPARGTPEDAKMLARYHLRRLKTRLQAALPKAKDEYTRIHYTEAIDRIDQALDARLTVGTAPAAR